MKTPRALAVGLIGYKFMGRAHSNAWRQAPRFFDLPATIRMKTLCGRDATAGKKAAPKLGWETFVADWREVVADPEIDVIDIATPNDSHCEIALAAARAGKAILCEKPLALDVRECEQMLAAVRKARVVHMLCHNYRRLPAIALAKQLIDAGKLGDRIYHFHARYAQDWIADPNFPLVWRLQSQHAGSGAAGDILSHLVDLARFLVGEFRELNGSLETFVKTRPLSGQRRRARVTVDDAAILHGKIADNTLVNLEATRFATGRKNQLTFEINGSAGSLAFDLEKLNRLQFYTTADNDLTRGFRDIIVTEPQHPFVEAWWPPGHLLGYEHSFVHTIANFVEAVVRRKMVQPNFEDGLENQRVIDALARPRP